MLQPAARLSHLFTNCDTEIISSLHPFAFNSWKRVATLQKPTVNSHTSHHNSLRLFNEKGVSSISKKWNCSLNTYLYARAHVCVLKNDERKPSLCTSGVNWLKGGAEKPTGLWIVHNIQSVTAKVLILWPNDRNRQTPVCRLAVWSCRRGKLSTWLLPWQCA